MCGILLRVRHHHDGCAFVVQLGEQLHYLLSVLGIEVTRRLVGQDKARFAHHGTCYGHTLLLTARELLWIVLGTMAHVHTAQDVQHPLLTLALGHVQVLELQFHVLLHGEFVDEVETLEHEAYASLAQTCALTFLHIGHFLAIERICTGVGVVKQAKDVQQG